MSRFGFGRDRRPVGSRPTALLPDDGSRLSDGVVVETRLTARLLGLRLLRVDGVVLMSPARLARPSPPTVQAGAHPAEVRPGSDDHVLAQAAQLLRENDAQLRRLR